MSRKAIFFIVFIFSAYSLQAIECFNDDSKKDIKALRMDVISLANRLESLESQDKSSLGNLRNDIASNNSDIASLKQEIEAIRQLAHTLPIELLGKIEEQKKGLKDSKELEYILIKYGNNPDGMAALHYAIKMGDVNAVNLLISNGADVNSITHILKFTDGYDEYVTAISIAAICDQFEIAKILLENNADMNFVTRDQGYYPIKYAAEFSSGDLVTLLVANGAKTDRIQHLVEESNGYPRGAGNAKSPLHIAAEKGNYEAVVALVAAGAQINGKFLWNKNIQNPDMETPLDLASKFLKYAENEQNLELVKFLVANGATRKNRKYYNQDVYTTNLCPVISGYLQSVGK